MMIKKSESTVRSCTCSEGIPILKNLIKKRFYVLLSRFSGYVYLSDYDADSDIVTIFRTRSGYDSDTDYAIGPQITNPKPMPIPTTVPITMPNPATIPTSIDSGYVPQCVPCVTSCID